jgi:hypothetical protein
MTYRGIRSVEATDDHKLILRFDNGEERIFDATPLLTVGRFRELARLDVFRKVRVVYDAVEWENGLDLDPEYVYDRSQAATVEPKVADKGRQTKDR